MTAVAFHFGAPDKLAYVCRLLRKAAGSGSRVMVVADDAVLQRIDADLWALSPTDFVSHGYASDSQGLAEHSSVVLVKQLGLKSTHTQVLLNLTDEVLPGFESFDRVIEVVSMDDADRESARRRWRSYTEQGYQITRHDLALKGAV